VAVVAQAKLELQVLIIQLVDLVVTEFLLLLQELHFIMLAVAMDESKEELLPGKQVLLV
jgi:hypothetical protein